MIRRTDRRTDTLSYRVVHSQLEKRALFLPNCAFNQAHLIWMKHHWNTANTIYMHSIHYTAYVIQHKTTFLRENPCVNKILLNSTALKFNAKWFLEFRSWVSRKKCNGGEGEEHGGRVYMLFTSSINENNELMWQIGEETCVCPHRDPNKTSLVERQKTVWPCPVEQLFHWTLSIWRYSCGKAD